jgi:aminopeptidase N
MSSPATSPGCVEAGLRSFIEQPGAPKITAKIVCGAKPKIALSQTRSLPTGVTDPAARTWKVPVCMRYGDAKTAVTKCVQLDGAQGELESELAACPSWIITNANARGYYRSAVDPAMVKALLTPASAIAKAARPSPAERMMLVADLRAAAERGELGIEQVLALVPVIAADPDDRVALYAFEAASFRADALDDALYAKTRQFFLSRSVHARGSSAGARTCSIPTPARSAARSSRWSRTSTPCSASKPSCSRTGGSRTSPASR